MRVFVCVLMCLFALSAAVMAAEPVKVAVTADDELLSAVAAKLAKDAGVNVIVDPKVDTKVSISLAEAELPQILDSLTKFTKLTWKKVQFAKQAEGRVTLDQIKSSIFALASMPLVAASVQDGSGKGAAMYARELPASAEVPGVKLPEGYVWSTVYVIYSPEQPAAETAAKPTEKTQPDTGAKNRFESLAGMSSEDRKKAFANEFMDMMTLTPEARRQVIQDQFSAVRDLEPTVRDQFLRDMSGAMRGMMGNQQNRNTNNSNRTNNTNTRNRVIPAR